MSGSLPVTPGEWAERAAGAGWHVFPVKVHDKEPATPHGHLEATSDPAAIRETFARRRFNYGIATGASGLLVVDVDEGLGPNGAKHGEASWAKLLADLGQEEPRTFSVRTPNGGRHLYFVKPADAEVASSNGRLGLDVDVRADTGYVVGPGSTIGADAYVVIEPGVPVADAPSWLVEAIQSAAGGKRKRATPTPKTARRLASVPEIADDPFDEPEATMPEGEAAGTAETLARIGELAAELVSAPEGVGNDTANRVAYMAGQYAAAGQVELDEAEEILAEALASWSWRRTRDRQTMLNTIRRSLENGAAGDARPWIAAPSEALDVASLQPEHQWAIEALDALAVAADDERNSLAREYAQRSVTLPAGAAQDLRDRVLARSDLTRSDWRQIVTEARAARRAAAVADWPEAPGPAHPLDVARHLAGLSGTRAPQYWRGDWYRWDGKAWRLTLHDLVFDQVASYLSGCRYLDRDGEAQPWAPTPGRVDSVVRMMAGVRRRDDEEEPSEALAVENGHLLDVGSGRPRLASHDPGRFVTHRLDVAWMPDAPCPRWLAFLDETFDDPETVDLIREWFGYVISGRVDLERILSISGPKRSGKSTLAHVLTALVGPTAVASMSLTDITRPHGEAPLVGKRLVLFGEANWHLREGRLAVEVLKSISGRDRRTIARKYLSSWEGVLPARLMIVGNDFPGFPDDAGALAARIMHVTTKRSVQGREDLDLRARLVAELPGILAWSVEGAATLADRGRFVEPVAVATAQREMRIEGSRIAGWLDDRASLVEGTRTDLTAAFTDYQAWAASEGTSHPLDRKWFARLLAATEGVTTKRVTEQNEQRRYVLGLHLRPVSVRDPFAEPGAYLG